MDGLNDEANAHLQELIDSVEELIVMKDGQGRWLAANRTARELFRLSSVSYRGKTDTELAPEVPALCPYLSIMARHDLLAWTSRKPVRTEQRFIALDGETNYAELAFSPHYDECGEPVRLTIVGRNITERKRIEAELSESEARYRLIAEHMSDVIGLVNIGGRITFVSPSVTRALGYESQRLIGQHIHRVIHAEDKASFSEAWEDIRRGKQQGQRCIECRCRRRDGEYLWFELALAAIWGADDTLESVVFSAREVSERKHQETLLHSMAFRDSLTQVLNRRGLMDRLKTELQQVNESSGFALLYMDLDGFKAVNDRWGHEAGDQLLTELAQRIQSGLRTNDSLARIGGDEFVVLLSAVGRNDALKIASRMCQSLDRKWVLSHGTVPVSASIGVALYPNAGSTPDELLRSADAALYEAKSAGRACVRLHGNY